MVYPDQLEMSNFRILFRTALKHERIGVTRTMSAQLALHNVLGVDREGMLFTVHTEKRGSFECWISQEDIKAINELYPDLSEASISKNGQTDALYVYPKITETKVRLSLYPTLLTIAKEKDDE